MPCGRSPSDGAAWSAPSSLDRVDGAYLGAVSTQREPQAAKSALARFVDSVADEPSQTMWIAIIDAVGRAKVTGASTRLVERLRADSVPRCARTRPAAMADAWAFMRS